MITLAMDTAFKYLTVALYKDDELLAAFSEPCFKRQSEEVFVQLEKLLSSTGLSYKDIHEMVITDGPGSYTGIRIAMTIAKVLCSQLPIRLYVISTLLLYAGMEPHANILLDARGKRAYAGHAENGVLTVEETILPDSMWHEFVEEHPGTYFGDALADFVPVSVDFPANFIALRKMWRPVENVHALVPRYLKESEAWRT